MQSDIERWERKYAERDPHARAEADPWLVELLPRLEPGLALDVACGAGANAVLLARSGFEVIGLDGSRRGVALARAEAARAGVEVALAVVDLDGWPPPADRFALVTVFRFLDRALLARLAGALAPGGVLVCKTFNRNRRRSAPAFSADYLLAAGELAALVRDLEVLEIDDGHGDDEYSRVLARRAVP